MEFRTRILISIVAVAVLLGGAVVLRWMASSHAPAAKSSFPDDIKVKVAHCDVGADGTTAMVKVYVQLRNDGTGLVRLGPGSFWLVDADGTPHLDRHAAEKPYTAPLVLKPGQTGPEMELEFILSPCLLARSLVLLIGSAPAGQVIGSPPPNEGIRVPVKDASPPKGPFVEGSWKTFVGTHWR